MSLISVTKNGLTFKDKAFFTNSVIEKNYGKNVSIDTEKLMTKLNTHSWYNLLDDNDSNNSLEIRNETKTSAITTSVQVISSHYKTWK